jgi:hypothetical protein
MSSNITYRKENSRRFKLKGVTHLVKESIIDGSKGLSFIFTKKIGDEFSRIFAKEIEKDKFKVTEKINDKESTKEMTMTELNKMLKSNKDLYFVKEYISNERGTYKGGAPKKSTAKKSSTKKASTKKSSRKKSSLKKY